MTYVPPVDQIDVALTQAGRIDQLARTGAYPNLDLELIRPILEGAGQFAQEVVAPLNAVGHRTGATLGEDGVRAPPGFREAYNSLRDVGLIGLSFPEEYGGQGLPKVLALAVMEMLHGASMAFSLCPLLTFGAIEALLEHGTDSQRRTYLPKLVSGEWTGAMSITEPQAGSDVGSIATKAIPQPDGSYAIVGQKIFISWGDHDLTENIIHLVLARIPGSPAGSKGLSLFVAPKRLVNADGSLGRRNAFECIGLENKIGIHASPTCVMEYDEATAWLVGQPNNGLAAMFTMMNSARLGVGIEGVAICEAALQAAMTYSGERKQGQSSSASGANPIVRHPDVQRTLATMAAFTQAARAICYECGAAAGLAQHAADAETRRSAKAREDLLTPIAKAWSTDRAVDVASLAVQVHGGLGFMNDTSAAQYYLDARILPIYEGTNGIQAIDLLGRKVSADAGAAMLAVIAEGREVVSAARMVPDQRFAVMAKHLDLALSALHEATSWMVSTYASSRTTALYGATNYLRLAGDVIGGHHLLNEALSTRDTNRGNWSAAAAYFYAMNTLTNAAGQVRSIMAASGTGGDEIALLAATR